MALLFFTLTSLLLGCQASYYLKQLSYTKLPATIKPTETFKMFAGTAEEAAYDPLKKILYVVGEDSRLLHILDLSDPLNPQRLLEYQFTTAQGKPRDVAVCDGELAVALSSGIADVYDGHVMLFNSFTKGDTGLTLLRQLPVGMFPDMLTYASDCDHLLVANEGRAGKDISGHFVDPEGTVTVIAHERSGNPSERTVRFDAFQNRLDLRIPERFIHPPTWPLPTHAKVAESLEPEYIAIDDKGQYAYVIMQENNAVAKISITDATVSSLVPLPNKKWSGSAIDPSSKDGGVHLRDFPLESLLQPDVAKTFTVGRKTFLFTANEGASRAFTNANHGFVWSDAATASTMIRQHKFDQAAMANDSFYAALANDAMAGDLTISIVDGRIPFQDDQHDKAVAFGGRGFSIWDTSDFSLVWDSGDEIEQKSALLMYNVFNTGTSTSVYASKSPENLKDVSSHTMGPKLNAMDVLAQVNRTNFLLVGSETMSSLYLYSINTTSGKPIPQFQSAHRAGKTDFVWNELYNMDEVGDCYISALGLISAANSPTGKELAWVVSAVSGTVSVYEIEYHQDPDNIFGR